VVCGLSDMVIFGVEIVVSMSVGLLELAWFSTRKVLDQLHPPIEGDGC
jgi:hypothetical protein